MDMAQEAAELQVKADAGDAAAQRELGIHCYYGWGMERNVPMVASLFKQVAEQGGCNMATLAWSVLCIGKGRRS